jgi:peptide/nickel transport system permease protein
MARVLVRSLGTLLLSVLLGSVLIFVALRLLGGDIANVILGDSTTPAAAAALRHRFGLDRPWSAQYLEWMSGVVHGDLGASFASGYDIAQEIQRRLVITVPLVLLSLTVSALIALTLGTMAALRAKRPYGILIDLVSQLGICVPVFWLGVLLVSQLSLRWHLFPAGGFVTWQESPLGALRSLALPATALIIPLAAVQTRFVRSSMLEVLAADYIRTARARGRTTTSAALVHGLRNASIPLVTVLGLQMGGLLGGTVVIEVIFNLPGLGTLLFDAVLGREVIVVQSVSLVLLIVILALNTTTDLLYGILDPRLRVRRSAPPPGERDAIQVVS